MHRESALAINRSCSEDDVRILHDDEHERYASEPV